MGTMMENKFTEQYINDNIFLEDSYGNEFILEQRGAETIWVDIEATKLLEMEADRIRMFNGFKPMFKYDVEHDEEGWYCFSAVITNDAVRKFQFEAVNAEEDDGGKLWEIQLTDDQKKYMHSRIKHLLNDELPEKKHWDGYTFSEVTVHNDSDEDVWSQLFVGNTTPICWN